MDDDSRALIEQMLAEEQFYYGRDTISTLPTKREKKANKKKPAKKPKAEMGDGNRRASGNAQSKFLGIKTEVSSSSLPSHKTRWTAEEDQLLKLALEKHGYGNWKAISEMIKTRNPLQCKNHARHWVLSEKIETDSKSPKAEPDPKAQESRVSEVPGTAAAMEDEKVADTDAIKDEVESVDEDDELISVEDDGSVIEPLSDIMPVEAKVDEAMEEDTESSDDKTHSPNDNPLQTTSDSEQAHIKEESDLSSSGASEASLSQQQKDADIADEQVEAPSTTEDSSNEVTLPEIKEEEQEEKQDTTMEQKAIPHDPIPEKQTVKENSMFDRHVISEEEQRNNPEWFNNKQSKTPDRYLKIRNHMLDCWEACKPRYLTKTSARKGLKDCGDVNAIGRVHSYLEDIGAINVGCTTTTPRPPRRVPRELYEEDNGPIFDAADLVIGYEGPRKRKVRNEHGAWVDPKELEGRVIEHGQPKPVTSTNRPKRVIKRPHQYFGGDDFSRGYDPFRLVPLSYYGDEDPSPFAVEVVSDCLLVMDFHSHLAHTEIIGLLGGNFTDVDGTKTLKVECVFPCRSTSTGIQCEMDPASEMKAREVFAEKGYTVVGWYHSHPTFEPQPSIRDIENQTSYQTLFRHEQTGDEPFIGVIVTPYDTEIVSNHSQIQYLHISNRWDGSHSFRMPYACRRQIRQSEQVSSEVLEQIRTLVAEFKDYEHKIDMNLIYGSQTRLEKLLDSLRTHLFLKEEEASKFLDTVKELMVRDFCQPEQSEKANEPQ
ncbi:uncharacterized protein BYT42DRAFT_72947 [Radiomyces spectabilis]|uniref:uncharacterized protein n=1 Tax=Radiomyces spectabilis TaxID=64574 RepID=UPI00221E3BA8|nr:uncharacterized protein BYT42DRAFT_72947 [Radiomyces spectabilis]KAI8371548.1 hypothetical protein BYT42DRAFT_72947 [Radiomyces spectabilis]